MSVINQALRDLEKRGENPSFTQGISNAPAPEQATVSARTSFSRLVIALYAALLVMLGFGVAYFFLGAPSNELAHHVAPYALSEDEDSAAAGLASVPPKMPLINSEPAEAIRQSAFPDPQTSSVSAEGSKYELEVTVAGESGGDVAGRLSAETALRDERKLQPNQGSGLVLLSRVSESADKPVIKSEDVSPVISKPDDGLVIEKQPVQVQSAQLKAIKPSEVEVRAPVPEKAIVRVSAESLDIKNAQSARDLLKAGDSDAAKARLEGFISESLINTASMYELAKLYVKTNDRAALDRLLNNRESFELPEMRLIAARRYLEKENLQSAGRTLESEMPAIARHPHYYALLASIYQKQQRYVLQADIYRQLIDIHGDRAKWWLGTAIAWDHLKQYGPATQAYKKTQQLTLNDPKLMAFVDQRLKQLRGR